MFFISILNFFFYIPSPFFFYEQIINCYAIFLHKNKAFKNQGKLAIYKNDIIFFNDKFDLYFHPQMSQMSLGLVSSLLLNYA